MLSPRMSQCPGSRLWHRAWPRPMSAAKRALRRAVLAWREGRGAAPQLLQTCDACGEERWRPLDRRHGPFELDAHLPRRRADRRSADRRARRRRAGRPARGRQPPARTGSIRAPACRSSCCAATTLADEPVRWRPVREHGLPAWRCRCALARSLPVDDEFSLRVIGCPIHLRRDDDGQDFARVIDDCARCAFFVGIGYAGNDRRRIRFVVATARLRPSGARRCRRRRSTRSRVAKSSLDRNPPRAVALGILPEQERRNGCSTSTCSEISESDERAARSDVFGFSMVSWMRA